MHAAWQRLLSVYLVTSPDGINRVRYARFKREAHNALKDYVTALQKVSMKRLARGERFAFWANLYNAKTIDIVLDHYSVESIRKINLGGGVLSVFSGGPWKAKVVRVDGRDLSLDDIEHAIMRPTFKDARVHYAVNCASIGCPNLMTEPLAGARLEQQLAAAAKDYVNHPRGVSVNAGRVQASKIYSWYQDDFGGNEAGVLNHLRRHATPALKSKLAGISVVDRFAYDWTLNDVTG